MENLLLKAVQYFWKMTSKEEAKKFLGLSVAAFFLIGANWPVKIGKDCLLLTEIGAGHQPFIKAISILICFPMMLLYSSLVSVLSGEAVLYTISLGFAAIGMAMAAGLRYASESSPELLVFLINAFYVYSECLTAISIAPFWAFVNDITKPEEAKSNYGMIVFFAQVGGLAATILARKISRYQWNTSSIETAAYKTAAPVVIMATSLLLIMFALSIFLTVRNLKHSFLEGYVPRHIKPKGVIGQDGSVLKDFINGFKTILSSPYVFGIFLLTSFQEIMGTLMHYSVLKSTELSFATKALRSGFVEDYELLVQIVAVVFSMYGTKWVQKKLGIRACLTFYPVILFFVFGFTITWRAAWPIAIAVAIAKGLYYALSKPVREILYIPTDKNVKYRSKAWIDIFGSRASKFTGSALSKLLDAIGHTFAPIMLFIPVLWILVAKQVGNTYHVSVSQGRTVDEQEKMQ